MKTSHLSNCFHAGMLPFLFPPSNYKKRSSNGRTNRNNTNGNNERRTGALPCLLPRRHTAPITRPTRPPSGASHNPRNGIGEQTAPWCLLPSGCDVRALADYPIPIITVTEKPTPGRKGRQRSSFKLFRYFKLMAGGGGGFVLLQFFWWGRLNRSNGLGT